MERKRVVVLGATGSIGESALKVARDIPERMEIIGLAVKTNVQKLAAQANLVKPEAVCLVDETRIGELRAALDYEPAVLAGEAGLQEIACLTNADMVLVAVVGTGGLRPALAAIEAGKDLAVASKEILVMAGEAVMGCGGEERRAGLARRFGAQRDLSVFGGKALSTSNVSSDLRRIILICFGRAYSVKRLNDEFAPPLLRSGR